MPLFTYRAKKGPNEVVNGDIEAATLDEALEKLEQSGLLPIHLDEAQPSETKPRTEEKKTEAAPPETGKGTSYLAPLCQPNRWLSRERDRQTRAHHGAAPRVVGSALVRSSGSLEGPAEPYPTT